jgi:uncharacterized membrane protein YbhN (UPF0104 family)
MGELGVLTTFHERSGAWRIRGAIRVVGLCLFTLYLVRGPTSIEATVDQLRGLPPAIWLLACGCNLIPPLAIAFRLKCLLRGAHHDVAYLSLARDSLRSTALNTVALMGTGDLYRLNRLRIYGVPLTTGSALAVLDRLFGIGALVAIVVALQAAGLGHTFDEVDSGLGVLALLCFVLLFTGFVALLSRPDGWMCKRLTSFGAIFGARGLSLPLFAAATAISFVACAAWVLCVYFLGQGLGLSIPLLAYFEAAPLVALATFIPITIGGVGLREAGYVLLLGSYGVSPSTCIALGIAQYSTFLGIAALGGLLFGLPDRTTDR